jgi:hypothetical protein
MNYRASGLSPRIRESHGCKAGVHSARDLWAGAVEGIGKMAVPPAWDVLLRPAMAERVSDAEHDDFGDDDALDQQEGPIGAKDAQRALNLALVLIAEGSCPRLP